MRIPQTTLSRTRSFGSCERSRQLLREVNSLDETFPSEGYGDFSVRWLLVHMVEEYARLAGQADLLRERLDCSTGV